jgi:hypothetical protein
MLHNNKQIDFFPNTADQRPRTRFNSVPLPWTNQLLPQWGIPNTKDQIQFSPFAMNKATSSQMQQTKDQGPDSIQSLCHEQINFFPNEAYQIPRTRFNSVPLPWTKQLLPKCSRPKTKDQIQFSSFLINKHSSSKLQKTKDQGPDSI